MNAKLPLILVSTLALTSCGTTTEERAASGALLGTAAGAAIGSFGANAGKGALIGAGVGALGGYLYDRERKKEERDRYYHDRHRESRYDPELAPLVW